jgi:hypothetical protein
VAALLALCLLALCELTTRLYFVPAVVGAETWTRYYPAYDSGFAEQGVCHPDGDDEVCLKTPYMNTPAGRFPRVKPAGETRIFVIGTSVGRGYPKPLQRVMHKHHREWNARVVSLAISGIGTERMVPLFSEAIELGADLILLHPHGTSEFKDEREHEYQERLFTGLPGLVLRSQFVVVAKKWMLEKLHLKGEVAVSRTNKAAARREAQAAAKVTRHLKTMTDHVDAMLELARKRKVSVIVIGRAHSPHGGDLYGEDVERAINASLRRSARRHAASYFDLTAAMAKMPGLDRAYRDGVHLTARGNRHAAKQLGPAISGSLRARLRR